MQHLYNDFLGGVNFCIIKSLTFSGLVVGLKRAARNEPEAKDPEGNTETKRKKVTVAYILLFVHTHFKNSGRYHEAACATVTMCCVRLL